MLAASQLVVDQSRASPQIRAEQFMTGSQKGSGAKLEEDTSATCLIRCLDLRCTPPNVGDSGLLSKPLELGVIENILRFHAQFSISSLDAREVKFLQQRGIL